MKLRQLAFTLHRYIGVMLGLLLVLIGLTGSLLVFGNEIDRFLNPQLLQVTPQGQRVSIESVLKTAQQTYPDQKPEHFVIPDEPNEVYTMVVGGHSSGIYANPYTGKLLGSRLPRQSLKGFLYDLHVSLLSGQTGTLIVSIGGVMLLVLSVTGLILWPGWGRLVTGLKIRWRSPWRIVNYDLHKVGGILAIAFLVLIASTGVAMSYWDQAEQLIYSLTNTQKVADSITLPAFDQPPLKLEQLLTVADAALPGAKTVWIDLPETPQTALRVRKKFPQEADPYGWSFVYLNQYNGDVLRVDNALKAPLAARIISLWYPLHIGTFGGTGTRILYLFVGLALPMLSITGFLLWWNRTYGLPTKRRRHRV
ncbi:MAG: PepSY domain-containing protein [Gloeocapsa sp. UFS-A4-WI-NPMV-4B04]|jgi:uncharacterized iron-regulated membrane protein|nr:PepSY domain-containing protein [Gloeocapsa sp. UFS-A4-WI-NPMV-4B04]